MAVVASPSYLDFGHFRAGINVGHAFVRFQAVCSPDSAKAGAALSKKSPDTTRLVKLAKVQFYKTGHKRQKGFMQTTCIQVMGEAEID